MSEAGVINQKSFMKLFSVSVHPSKALHLSPIMTLCACVCVQQMKRLQVHSDYLYMCCIKCGRGRLCAADIQAACTQSAASGELVGKLKLYPLQPKPGHRKDLQP